MATIVVIFIICYLIFRDAKSGKPDKGYEAGVKEASKETVSNTPVEAPRASWRR